MNRSRVRSMFLCAGLSFLIAGFGVYSISAQQTKQAKQAPEPKGGFTGYIGGVVQGEKGPEAGVWVIAETKDLLTGFIKTVVTDDQGRFMLPELPPATYKVWARGYGIVDSPAINTKPTTTSITIKATSAKTPQEAAKVYPADYWLSLLAPPDKSLFPGTGTGAQGNGMGTGMLTQDHWINALKSNCNFCHQLGNAWTRDLKHVFMAKPELKTSAEAWEWRLGVGVRGSNMLSALTQQMGAQPALKVFSDWTDRIDKGEVPPSPPRPKGIERNVVSTQWDIGDDHSFIHDQISTDKNHPTVNGGGKMYAVSAGHGQLVWVDPRENSAGGVDIPTRDPKENIGSRFPAPIRPSFVWGNEHLWSNPPNNPADPHNAMFDSKGRLWMTAKIRGDRAPGSGEPAWCNDGSNKYSAMFPLRGSARQAAYYVPSTGKWQLIETCYATHHLQFDNDPDETVYFNELSGPVVGWIDTKIYDDTLAATKDERKAEQAAVGWCEQVLDTNGDGIISKPFNEVRAARGGEVSILYESDTAGATKAAPKAPPPGSDAAPAAPGGARGGGRAGGRGAAPAAPFDPKLDTHVSYSLYSVIPSPVDDSVWGISESFPGMLVRMMRGNNAPASCKTQLFKVPAPGYDPRGVDVDSNGVVWTALAATSHLASFDVRKCTDLNGPAKTDGSQCKEGWTLYQTTGPKLKGTDVPADFHYYNWVDQHNIIGLGANTPFATGSNSDSLIALNPQTKAWTYFRIPYPLGFYSRGMDGRIDDPNGGWKGRALYSNYGTHFVWHIEGGKGTKGKIVKFQLRPDPLAR